MKAILNDQQLSASIHNFLDRKMEKFPDLANPSVDRKPEMSIHRSSPVKFNSSALKAHFGLSAQGYIMKGI